MTPRLWIAVALIATTGCQPPPGGSGGGVEPITPETSTRQAEANLELHLQSLSTDLTALIEELPIPGLTNSGPDGEPCEDCVDSADVREQLDALVETLRSSLDRANIESERSRTVVYRLPMEAACDPGEICEEEGPQIPIRVKVTSPNPGDVDLAILVGEDRHPVLRIRLYQNELGLTLDLEAASELAGQLIGDGEAPLTLTGTVDLTLRREAADHYTIVLVTNDVSVSAELRDERLAATLGDTRLELDMSRDGQALVMALEAAFGGLDLQAPLGMLAANEVVCAATPDGAVVCDEPERPEGQVEVKVPSAGVGVTLRSDTRQIAIDGLRLGGPVQVLADGRPMVEFDFNAATGRVVDAIVQFGEEALELTVRPGLDVAFAFDPSALGEPDARPEDFQLTLDQAEAPKVRLSGELLQVVEGRLRLSSDARDLDLTAEAGQCIASQDSEEEQGLEVVACAID